MRSLLCIKWNLKWKIVLHWSNQSDLNSTIVRFDPSTVFCFVVPSPHFIWVLLLTQWTGQAVVAPWQHADDWGGGGARLAPVEPTAFLHFHCSFMQHTPLKVLYKVRRAWTTTIEIWAERSAAVINHLSINHCHPRCFATQPMAPWGLENLIC